MHFLERLLGLGAHASLSSAALRRVHLCNLGALIGLGSGLGFAVGFAVASVRTYAAMVMVNVAGALLMGSSLLWNARHAHRVARVSLMLTANVHVAIGCVLAGRGVGFQHYFFVFPPVTLLLMPGRADRAMLWALTTLSPALYLFVEHHPLAAVGLTPVPTTYHAPMHVLTTLLTFATLAVVVFSFYLEMLRAEDALEHEHERSEGLLRNILPDPIARRLKTQSESIADGFAEVSVLFADLVGFTELSSRLPPGELVQLLNRVFSELDDLTEKRGLEKIKTIGDAYMVAAGLPEPRPDHAHATARFGWDMLAVVERISRDTGHSLSVRIGIHTGPVVAGVIGKRKFIYDLWGDTVNIASRMESHGTPGAIQVSEEVARRIGDEFELSEPRTITVKGKGEMVTRILLRRKLVTRAP